MIPVLIAGGLAFLGYRYYKHRKEGGGALGEKGKVYLAAASDVSNTVAQRFGVTFQDIQSANGKTVITFHKKGDPNTPLPVKLPSKSVDSGPRPGAMGKVA